MEKPEKTKEERLLRCTEVQPEFTECMNHEGTNQILIPWNHPTWRPWDPQNPALTRGKDKKRWKVSIWFRSLGTL